MKKETTFSQRKSRTVCKHDYKNAIKVGNIDYLCPLCKNPLDPLEWFFMNSFDFIDVSVESESESGRGVITSQNVKTLQKKKLKEMNYVTQTLCPNTTRGGE